MSVKNQAIGPVWAIVVAGGSGTRYGKAKQYELIGTRPVVAWSIDAARSVADGIVVVLPESDVEGANNQSPPLFGADIVVAGGATRSESVRAGLSAVPLEASAVIVHDAARPGATPALFSSTLEALGNGVGGAIAAVQVSDTIKRVNADGEVLETLNRDELVAVQTPQAFLAATLRSAHASGSEATDDAGLLEKMGSRVVVVPGEITNRKITTAQDIAVLSVTLGIS
jgi:2-C-methyl-D-erythritol 4-phosphate cytidylyltransferase